MAATSSSAAGVQAGATGDALYPTAGPSAPAPARSDLPSTVLRKTLLVTAGGVAFGASYGILKHNQPTQFAVRQGFNALIFALPFFTISEYAVRPTLDFLGGRAYTTGSAQGQQPRNLRTEYLGSSAIAGAITGAGVAAAVRGPRSIVPGMATFGVLCLTAQYIVNELDIARIKLIAGYAGGLRDLPTRAVPESPVKSSSSSQAGPTPTPISPAPASSSSSSSSSPSPSAPASETPGKDASSAWSFLSSIAPMRKVSDDEYAVRLAADLQAAEARLSALKREADELEAQLAHSHSQPAAGTGTARE
ncbi:hypothetical protein OC844_005555 [Tilletia horrida]|nr:hypothetical protein OC844_005555 [Tilletia horrida]